MEKDKSKFEKAIEDSIERSKYYIPEIEEFHVGFECEYKELDSNEYILDNLSRADVSYLLCYPENAKVKYLDKKDIESLGWTFERITTLEEVHLLPISYEIEGWHLFINKKLGLRLYVIGKLDLSKFKVIIRRMLSDGNILGVTELKNKSELKRLMKQLNIKEC